MVEIIDLKIDPEYFYEQRAGLKNFEIRKNDRQYKRGQCLRLKEWTKEQGYSGRVFKVKITTISTYEQKENYVVLGTKPVTIMPKVFDDFHKSFNGDQDVTYELERLTELSHGGTAENEVEDNFEDWIYGSDTGFKLIQCIKAIITKDYEVEK